MKRSSRDMSALFSKDEAESHLEALKKNPRYRGFFYEQRISDALKSPNVGGLDVSDLYLTLDNAKFGDIITKLYDNNVNLFEYYCGSYRNGLSIEVKTSSSPQVSIRKTKGFIVRDFYELNDFHRENVEELIEKTPKREAVFRAGKGWVIDQSERWSDLYCLIFFDDDGELKDSYLVPTFMIEEDELRSRVSESFVRAKYGEEFLFKKMKKADFSSNDEILKSFFLLVYRIIIHYGKEIMDYKERIDAIKSKSRIKNMGRLF
ncbi:hypothetical protein TH15_20890 [Thalassospira profundimaris]|nr:hypothetical protein TH15_20890 [Thalassospira profundimaris]